MKPTSKFRLVKNSNIYIAQRRFQMNFPIGFKKGHKVFEWKTINRSGEVIGTFDQPIISKSKNKLIKILKNIINPDIIKIK
jgi:hypothetical protein